MVSSPEFKGKDLSGQRFGRLVALYPVGRYLKKVVWRCQCDCGKTKDVIGCNLSNGGSTSCGCKSVECARERNFASRKHGLGGTPTYNTWFGMVARCTDPSCNSYHNYGGRGIRVCAFLAESPKNFVAIMGMKPETVRHRALSVDRIDTNGHYSCGQCQECVSMGWKMNIRWATQKQQMRNFRGNHIVEIEGRKQCLAAWEEEYGLKTGTLLRRIQLGWSGKQLLVPSLR